MKTRWIQLIAGLAMVVLCISTCTTTTNADVIWEDDFSDPNLPGWSFYGYASITNYTKTEGNFSAADGTLKVLDDDVNVARHDSTTSVGTWSFDMFVPDDGTGTVYLEFMSNGWDHYYHPNSSVLVVGAKIYENRFNVWDLTGASHNPHESIPMDSLQGWHHINVSRNSDNRILVYLNGTLEADFVCHHVTSSTYLQLWCENAKGAAIDNLVVTDEVPITTTPTPTPTTPPPTLPWELIAIGGGVVVVVIVLAIVCLRRR
jgi:hypothetical protein